jgi:pyruvate dehydrogenase E2 component (dihydrolipoamide acetyltransferase)
VAASSGGMTVPPPQYRTPKGLEHLETRTPLRGMRRVISNAMIASHLYTVRTLTVDEANLTALVDLRERLKPTAEKVGVKITYLPFIFKAVASALKAFPNVNSSYDEATGEVVHKQYFNVGCAVDTEAGLIVPVVKNVDSKSILEIAKSITDLAGKAREGKLTPDEISGSSFAVTNIGSAGSLLSFPIINAPDAAILGVHTIVDRPIVKDGQIVIGKMMYLSLSFDHRLIDGAEAARFLKQVTRLLENPDLLLLEAI